jgi:hypothetical protein
MKKLLLALLLVLASAVPAASQPAVSGCNTYGTGTNCNANTVQVIPPISVAINSSFVDRVTLPQIAIPALAAGTTPVDVCLTTVGAGPTTVIIYYAQF